MKARIMIVAALLLVPLFAFAQQVAPSAATAATAAMSSGPWSFINWAMLLFVGASAVAVVAAVLVPAFTGKPIPGMKPIRANLLWVVTMAATLALFLGLRGFEWLQQFIPDTDWWDGATFMGALIAGLGLLASLFSMMQTAVSALTTDPSDPPPDPLHYFAAFAEKLIDAGEQREAQIDRLVNVMTVVEADKPGA